MLHVCPINFVWKERKKERKKRIIIILTKTIVFTMVMVKPNNLIYIAPACRMTSEALQAEGRVLGMDAPPWS